jgi:hypothetical protein
LVEISDWLIYWFLNYTLKMEKRKDQIYIPKLDADPVLTPIFWYREKLNYLFVEKKLKNIVSLSSRKPEQRYCIHGSILLLHCAF